MTDREILELAAKAAGMNVNRRCQNGRDADGHGDVGLWISEESTCWNPLNDDGDAFRLAIRLGMNVEERWATYCPERGDVISHVVGLDDELEATRRSIVLVAADLGKAMP